MFILWPGNTLLSSLNDYDIEAVQKLSSAVENAGTDEDKWLALLEIQDVFDGPVEINHWPLVSEEEDFDKADFWSPLQVAAHRGVSLKVIEALINRGAWRSYKDRNGYTALDIARKANHTHLLNGILEPKYFVNFSEQDMDAIEAQFHQLIRSRVGELVDKHKLRLPQLRTTVERMLTDCVFAIPQYCGGFYYNLEVEETRTVYLLNVGSWSRVCGGSGQRHYIRPNGIELIEDGFSIC